MKTRKGRCLCGSVQFEFDGPENWIGHCHCQSCRLNTASPFTTFIGVPRVAYRHMGKAPLICESSPGVRRHFCPDCGAPIAYDAEKLVDEIHFYLAALEDTSGLMPQFHVFFEERVPWVNVSDDLPKYVRGTKGPMMDA